jgi:Holliday junction resolvase
MSRKGKGIAAERELFHMLWSRGFACARVAGSGANRYPSVDLIAGKGARKLVIECKSTKDETKYFLTEEIEQARTFADLFGGELWFAIKFSKMPWYLVSVDQMEKTPQGFKVSRGSCNSRGLLVEDVVGVPQTSV